MPVLETESTCKYHMSLPLLLLPSPPHGNSYIMYRLRGGRGEGGWCSAEWRSEGGGGREVGKGEGGKGGGEREEGRGGGGVRGEGTY